MALRNDSAENIPENLTVIVCAWEEEMRIFFSDEIK